MNSNAMTKSNELIEQIKDCITIDFEHAQYRLWRGVGYNSTVLLALDDALLNVHESDRKHSEYICDAIERLMEEYQGSRDFAVIPRLYCKVSGSFAEYDLQWESVNVTRLRECEAEQDWEEGETILDGYVLNLDDERYDVIPHDIRAKIKRDIEQCEHYFCIDIDFKKIDELIQDAMED